MKVTSELRPEKREVRGIVVAQNCCQSLSHVLLCDPMDCSTLGFSVYHLPEFAQTHLHCVSDDMQPSHPLSRPFPPILNLSQNQGFFPVSQLFTSGSQILELPLQHQSF